MTAHIFRRLLEQERRAALLETAPPRRCWCGQAVTKRSTCGCCCLDHDAALDPRTDGGPSVHEYLESKGER